MASVPHDLAASDLNYATDVGVPGKHQAHTGKKLENFGLEVTDVIVTADTMFGIVQGRMEQ
jgi:hypothetical protein